MNMANHELADVPSDSDFEHTGAQHAVHLRAVRELHAVGAALVYVGDEGGELNEAEDKAATIPSRAVPLSEEARAGFVRQSGECIEEDSLKQWWKHVNSYPLLTWEREVELARRIEAGDELAKQEMVECNLRLVASIARKCRRSVHGPLSLADLVQEGSLGLMRAVKKFDYRKGYKFSTYASYWIRQAILRSIDEQSRSIRLPVYVIESATKAEKARTVLTHELHRPPTQRELAAHLQVPTSKVQELTDKVPEPISLDSYISEDDDSTIADFIEDTTTPSPADCALRSALRDELERAFQCLSDREAEVLSLRYGMDPNGHARTLDEVGALLNLTRERIRQIEKMALKRLKRSTPLRETARDYGRSSHTESSSLL
jgi:RNA polymerase primary sigma factor